MKTDFDIAIVGSGFGGSLLAMIAKRLGRSVILIERGQHPRFAIGESSTPLTNLLLEELAQRYGLPRLLPLAKWGSWQTAYPGVGCGLKRGFSFYHHAFGTPWKETFERDNQLLVGASPHDRIADTHWYRPDFDHFLVREAQAIGVDYVDRVKLAKPEIGAGGFTLRGEREGKALCLKASFLVDAAGARGFLHQTCEAVPQKAFAHQPSTQALFTHFSGVRRWEELCPSTEVPPYPVDDAAVHHIFDGGWIWVLRFNNGITSAGVAAALPLANKLRLEEGAPAWERLLKLLPTVREQFAQAGAERPFIHVPQLSFRHRLAGGAGWALLPSAAGFVDPLLSTGFPLTLLGIARLAQIIQHWDSDHFVLALRDYSEQTFKELDAAELMVAALYANMNDFSIFSRLSLLYFAAASFTEAARRLGQPELAGDSFLLGDHPRFGPQADALFHAALGPLKVTKKEKLKRLISQTIEPVDVAGLGDQSRRNWFPVDARDLLQAAPKLKAGEAEIRQLLERCGFGD